MKRFMLLGFLCLSFAAQRPGLAKTMAQDWIPLQDGKSLVGW